MKNTSSLIALIFLLISGSVLAQTPSAQRITAANAQTLNKGGPDAISGIGDWHLSNGTLCAVISDVEHEHEFSHRGGVLIDLGFCDREDDHFAFMQDLIDADRQQPLNADHIRVDVGESASGLPSASIIVDSSANGVAMQTTYTLDQQDPTQLKISKRLRITDSALADFNLLSFTSFNYLSLEPFVFASQAIERSPGFANIDFVSRGLSAIGEAAHNADTIITLSPPDAKNPIAYGWHLRAADRVDADMRTRLPRFVLADEESTAMLILADSFWVGDGSEIGWLQLPQIPFLSADADTLFEFEEVVYVGKTASISAVTDQIFTDTATIKGQAEANTALHLLTKDGAGITHHHVGDNGRFAFQAPPGDYLLRHRASADRRVDRRLSHSSNTLDLGALNLPDAARLLLPKGEAMRLVFVGINGTQSPNFIDRLTDFSVADDHGKEFAERLAQVYLAGVESDPRSVNVPAGDYKVFATRGLEHSLESTTVSIKAGETLTLDIRAPQREIDTPGYIAADLHVHAGDSFDNTFSNEERVRTFVAEHGEIMVNSEHDVAVNFAPLLRAMGVEDKIASMTGTEVTSLLSTANIPFTGGHVNFFPFEPRPLEYRNGMVKNEGQRLRDVIHDVRALNPSSLAQLNHPRRNLALSGELPSEFEELIDTAAYLDHMGAAGHPYNPNQPLHTHPNNVLLEVDETTGLRDLDFDAIEIVNPSGEFHQERIEAVRRDWMSFLLQGVHVTGTANSDSHSGSEQVAVPRNMVAVSNDSVNGFDRAEFLASIKTGHSYGTSGPMVELNLSGKHMGEMFAGAQAELNLTVTSVSWIPLHTALVQINGITVQELDLTVQREWNIPLSFEHDALVTVEIHGDANEEYQTLYPVIQPYAFTNPIYVDANADGQWEAPGLQPSLANSN